MMHVSQSIYEQLVAHGEDQLPYEACGLLAGNVDDCVLSIWSLENEWKSSFRYYVSKKVVESTVQQIELQGQKVLGVYHSHPTTAPIPSYHDLQNHPDHKVKMIIISYKNALPTLKCYTVMNNTYDEYPFYIDPEQ